MQHEPIPQFADLADFNAQLDDCAVCTTVARGFRHVPGGGCDAQPDLMLVFINPTVLNPSAHASWTGQRLPFANKLKLWQILAEAGWISPRVPEQFATLGPTPALTALLAHEAARHRIYLTNAVKCVDDASNLPPPERVAGSLPQLQAEIALVRPKHIVALGLIPFRALTGRTVRLADELWAAGEGHLEPYPSLPIAAQRYPVFPCYFPTGRGNPVAATKMLAALHRRLQPVTDRNRV